MVTRRAFLAVYIALSMIWFAFFELFPKGAWLDPVWDVGLLALFLGSGMTWWRLSRG